MGPMIDKFIDFMVPRGLELLVQALSALLLFIVGRWVIWAVRGASRRALAHRRLDVTLARYIDQSLGVLLTLLLIVAALGVLGVQTNSIAGLLAAAGLAIGVAWSGLLSNIAAGIFMVILRPFKKDDTVQIGGVLGTVEEIGLFVTKLLAPDGSRVIVGNTRAFSENIQNLSAGPYRRYEARVQLPWAFDPNPFYGGLRSRLVLEPKVLKDPAAVVETVEHNAAGPVATVRSFCDPADYLEVMFLTQRILGEEIRKAGIPAPNPLPGIK